MTNGFIPLSKSIQYWPGFFDQVDFLEEVGLRQYETQVNNNNIIVSGELIVLTDISFPFFGITGMSVALLNEAGYTILPFECSTSPVFSLSLPNISVSFLMQYDFLVPVELIGGVWTPITDVDGIPKAVELRLDTIGIDFSLTGDFSIGLNPSSAISLNNIQLGNTGIVIELDNITPYFSTNQSLPNYAPPGFKGVSIENASMQFPAFWNHDVANSTAVVKGRNLLLGTGGLSGTLGLEAITTGDPNPLIKANLGGFAIELNAFDITFDRNSVPLPN